MRLSLRLNPKLREADMENFAMAKFRFESASYELCRATKKAFPCGLIIRVKDGRGEITGEVLWSGEK